MDKNYDVAVTRDGPRYYSVLVNGETKSKAYRALFNATEDLRRQIVADYTRRIESGNPGERVFYRMRLKEFRKAWDINNGIMNHTVRDFRFEAV